MAKLLGEGVYVCNDWFDATHIKLNLCDAEIRENEIRENVIRENDICENEIRENVMKFVKMKLPK